MLADFPKKLIFIFLGMFLILGIGTYVMKNYQSDSSTQSIQETLKATALENRDNSSRLEKGTFKVVKPTFESDFKKSMAYNRNYKLDKEAAYTFDYLDDGQGGIKAIKVKVTDNGETYQATCVLSLGQD
ncbi:hypothetical protein [Brochothrix campestris]|uniref:Uncharacterized protein n=1 Tax=Brochothrix campestris FSL F6-1037 TaxID=1265861 RepID=W7CM43_9LIST|nr:hypothetical protein [Brochothrix campestris]EUJ34183.1 hypothetical protein BCAMP_12518 [Brochothrix campestris FSL F6-1037]